MKKWIIWGTLKVNANLIAHAVQLGMCHTQANRSLAEMLTNHVACYSALIKGTERALPTTLCRIFCVIQHILVPSTSGNLRSIINWLLTEQRLHWTHSRDCRQKWVQKSKQASRQVQGTTNTTGRTITFTCMIPECPAFNNNKIIRHTNKTVCSKHTGRAASVPKTNQMLGLLDILNWLFKISSNS